jgi:diguanylate cyclase (GGDEF)-like protein
MNHSSHILYLTLLSLAEQATRDPLTNLYNRRYFDEALTDHIALATRYNRSLTLLLLDLNQFKKINDTCGHQAGDERLCQFAQHLLKITRDADLVFRYGGDEFAILLPETTLEGAEEVVHRLHKNTPHPFEVGYASLPTTTLFIDADQHLLSNKQKKEKDK